MSGNNYDPMQNYSENSLDKLKHSINSESDFLSPNKELESLRAELKQLNYNSMHVEYAFYNNKKFIYNSNEEVREWIDRRYKMIDRLIDLARESGVSIKKDNRTELEMLRAIALSLEYLNERIGNIEIFLSGKRI